MLLLEEKIKDILCPVEKTIVLIGTKWNLMILRTLYLNKNKPIRFNELLRSLKPISSKTLSVKLKELVSFEIVNREIIPTTPVVINYSFSEKGKDLEGIFKAMAEWSLKWHGIESITTP